MKMVAQSNGTQKEIRQVAEDLLNKLLVDNSGYPTVSSLSAGETVFFRGKKRYEMSNHLGNVLAVVSDKRTLVCINGTQHYEAEIIVAQDYYPFGMIMPERSYSATANGYRFAFNGMEQDNEVSGSGNSYDFGARIYDSRLSRWMSVDPRGSELAGQSPYSFANNSPIAFVDPDGEFAILAIFPPILVAAVVAVVVVAVVYAIVKVIQHVAQKANEVSNAVIPVATVAVIDAYIVTAGKLTEVVSDPNTKPKVDIDPDPSPKPDPKPVLPLPIVDIDEDEDKNKYVYRAGKVKLQNLTPSDPKDVNTGPRRGLSTFTTAEEAKARLGTKDVIKLSVKILEAQG